MRDRTPLPFDVGAALLSASFLDTGDEICLVMCPAAASPLAWLASRRRHAVAVAAPTHMIKFFMRGRLLLISAFRTVMNGSFFPSKMSCRTQPGLCPTRVAESGSNASV